MIWPARLKLPVVAATLIFAVAEIACQGRQELASLRAKTKAASLPAVKRDSFGDKTLNEARKITVAVVQSKSAIIKQDYRCRIESQRYVRVRSPVEGRIGAIRVKEGQPVKRGDLLFEVSPRLQKEMLKAEGPDKMVSIEAPCDGLLVGLKPDLEGGRVRKGESLASVSDAGAMWVLFDMPERHYLEFMAERSNDWRISDLELILADNSKYPYTGKLVDTLASIHNETGDVTFEAEFPNPYGVLRRGQTGTLLMKREVKNATLLIPRKATFDGPYLWKRYVYVVGEDKIAHRREIVGEDEAKDDFVVETGIRVGDKFVVDGVNLVQDGDKIE